MFCVSTVFIIIIVILRICSPPRAPSEKNAAVPEQARVSDESERYARLRFALSENSGNPRLRRAADPGSASPRNDRENASAAQIPCWIAPQAYQRAAPC